jgi:hypothetical protein
MNLFEMFEQPATFKDALTDFLPMCVGHLQLTQLPKIAFQKDINTTSFGTYDADTDTITLVLHNRQPVDILRTLAHELVHAQQRQSDKIKPGDGRTGSPIEDEANAEAGVIMRVFAQEYPKYLTLPAVSIPSQLKEKRKRKKKSKPRGYGGFYGYYYGGTNTSTENGGGGGDGGGGESMNEGLGRTALVGVLAAALSMVVSPAQAEPSDAAKALGIYRTINRYKDYNSAALEGEANQELMNILRSIQGHPNQSKLLPIIKKMITSDENGTAPTRDEDLPPMTLPGDEVQENFADGKKPGRKGLAKRSGVDCKQSVTALRKVAKNSSGERQRMAHWCANMKSGRNK